MNVTQVGIKCVWGVPPEIKPIKCDCEGRQRLRLRNTEAARLFVKTDSGIHHFILVDKGDHWFADPELEQGRNLRQN